MTVGPGTWRLVMKLGDAGPDVMAWRVVLLRDGYDLTGTADAFNTSVHNATVGWQKARGLTGDGIVGGKTRALIDTPPLPRPPPIFDPNRIPYVEAVSWSRTVPAQPKSVIVIHCMEWPEASTSAEWCARYFAGLEGKPPAASAHYCVDDDTVISCVPPDRIAWHAPGANRQGIGIEHAGYARQSRAQWLDDFSLRMLMLSAQLTAHLCRRFSIPVQFIVADHLRRGARGITTHAECTRAWPEKGSHMDPGVFFPLADYMRFVVEARGRQDTMRPSR